MTMKAKDEVRGWLVLFAEGLMDRVPGKTPEVAARRIVKAYFGPKAEARRITGAAGKPGRFEAIGASGRPLTVFDVAGALRIPYPEEYAGTALV